MHLACRFAVGGTGLNQAEFAPLKSLFLKHLPDRIDRSLCGTTSLWCRNATLLGGVLATGM